MAKKAKNPYQKKRRKKPQNRTQAIDSVVGQGKKINGIELYQVENALETMTRANEIKKDEKLMAATDKLLERRKVAMGEVARQIRSRK